MRDEFNKTIVEESLKQIVNRLNIQPKPIDDFNFSDRTIAMASIIKVMKDLEKES